MKLWGGWRKKPLGKRWAALHAWNAWLVLALAVTGILLFLPSIRELGVLRVLLKQAHVVIGLVSALVVAVYLPSIARHIRLLRGKPGQRFNLALVLILLAGWIVSGLVLWQFRRLPPAWSNAALVAHDLLTWVGVPYAAYHSIVRSRWLRSRPASAVREAGSAAAGEPAPEARRPLRAAGRSAAAAVRGALYSRRTFLRWAIGALLLAVAGPRFVRWLFAGTGGAALPPEALGPDGNRMLPEPVPHPDSLKPLGGGSRGNFRVYTVTDIPAFSSDNWTFTVGGLVDRPLAWNWTEFLELQRQVQVSDFHCVTGWSVYSNTWEGIPLSRLLEMAGVQTGANFVKFYSGDGVYTDTLTLPQARMDDVLVAVLREGKPIPQQLGGPVRLVVPKMYAYKSVKWLQSIELIAHEDVGYWEARGYDTDAWVPGLKPKPTGV